MLILWEEGWRWLVVDGGRNGIYLCRDTPRRMPYISPPDSLSSKLQDTLNRLSSSFVGRFQCSQRLGSIGSVLVPFRRSQAYYQVNSVPIIQSSLKDNGVYLGQLQLGLDIPLCSSIEAPAMIPLRCVIAIMALVLCLLI